MRSVLSADKIPHTNKEEVYRYKVTARDVLSTISMAYELLMIFEALEKSTSPKIYLLPCSAVLSSDQCSVSRLISCFILHNSVHLQTLIAF